MTRRVALLLVIVGLGGCGADTSEDQLCQTDKTRLETRDVQGGRGAEARQGRRVSVHYTGWLYHPTKPEHHGRKFDSSRDRSEPFDFTLGAGDVIPGWDEGVQGMKVGGRRTLIIPRAWRTDGTAVRPSSRPTRRSSSTSSSSPSTEP